MGRAKTCVVISADGVPLARISPERAIVNIEFKQTMYLVEAHPRKFMRSKDKVYPWPEVVGIVRHHNLPRHYYGPVPLSSEALYKRDSYTCQYCGRKEGDLLPGEFLNKDHVFPQDRGGEDIWENMVTACNTCNNKKANRTPQEAGMTLRCRPYAPNRWQIFKEKLKVFHTGTSAVPEEEDVLDVLGVLD